MIRFILNEKEVSTELPPGTLVLDYVRYHRHLMGTKIGCREGDCGACVVLVGEVKNDCLEYSSATSCLMPLHSAAGKHIVTIEGLNTDGLNFIQQAMCDEAATQCGFCTPGFVVSLAGFCLSGDVPNSEKALASVNGNICRCTGYKSIERATARVAAQLDQRADADPVSFAVANKMLPAYFKKIRERLAEMQTSNLPVDRTIRRKFLGGGTDLYVQQPELMIMAAVEILAYKKIYQKDGRCYVGGAATVNDILHNEIFQRHFPQLGKFLKLVSSTPIRNMATVGGNLVNASPIGDLTIFFLALDAHLILSDVESERIVPLRQFYKGYKQLDKSEEEFIVALFFELPQSNQAFNFEKVSKRTHLDIASVNSAINIQMSGDRIIAAGLSAGGVGPVPMYLEKTSQLLKDKILTSETILAAIEVAQTEVAPISDARGSEGYKLLLLGQLIKAHFIMLFPGYKEKLLADGLISNTTTSPA